MCANTRNWMAHSKPLKHFTTEVISSTNSQLYYCWAALHFFVSVWPSCVGSLSMHWKISSTKAVRLSQIKGWHKNHLSFLNFPPDFKSKQILIGQQQFFQCWHWLTAIQNKQKGGKFELDKSHLGHPSKWLNLTALTIFKDCLEAKLFSRGVSLQFWYCF